MTAIRNQRRARRFFWLAAIFGAFLHLSGVPRVEASNVAGKTSPKLATVLADLARAISPAPGQAPAERAAQGAVFSMESMPKSVRDAARHRTLRINANNEVQVYILMDAVTDENLSQLRANGVTIEIPDAVHRRLQARIPVNQLQSVAALPFVNFIRPPNYAIRLTGSVDTEGDLILQAQQARTQFGVDGTGVHVGVISDGLKGVFATGCTTCSGVAGGPISTGDLPSATGTRNTSGVLTSSSGGITGQSFQSNHDLEGLPAPSPPCGFAGAGAEGTGLLEIVHDIAPGAQLSFANADTDMAFENAVNSLAATNDVVTDDLGFLGFPYDGTSPVSANTASALNSSTNAIRGYFTSVGNFADEHYYGLYTPSTVDGTSISGITNPGFLHLFQQATSPETTDVLTLGPKPYNVIKLCAAGQTGCPVGNSEVVIFLTWDDAFGASSNDYDLYLVQESTGTVVASSTNVQTGTQDPLEIIDYVNNTGTAGFFHIVVQNFHNTAQPRHLNIFSFEPECATDGPKLLAAPRHERLNFNTATLSVPAQSDSGGTPVSVTSVGAICSASAKAQALFTGSLAPDESCFDNTNSTIEFFSSLGPTHPTLDGTDPGRTKPDITAIDGVSVTGAGSFENPFFGTSAAAPHMAGIAALALQSAPCLLTGSTGAVGDVTARTNLRNLILDNAVPLGATIPNNTFGFGRADALAAVQGTLPIFTGLSTVTVSGNTPSGASLTPTQLGFTDPNTCPLTKLNWTGGCSTGPASSMTCPFGTNTVSVSASNNGVAFSSAASVQIVVTNFSVGVSPTSTTVAAGQSATYTITVSPQGGTFSSPVTLACTNLPAQTSCAFNPSTVTPGSGSAQSTLTISTTARSLAPTAIGAPPVRLIWWVPFLQLPRGPQVIVLWLGVVALTLLGLAGMICPGRCRLTHLVRTLIVLVFLAFAAACGGSNAPPSHPGTPTGSHSINITGTAGTLVNSGAVTLMVQ